MAQAVNRYKADLREIEFVLFEQLKLQELLGKAPFEAWGVDEVKMVLPEVYRFACEVSGPLNQIGDQVGCKLVDGHVKTPTGFQEAWKRLHEAGWNTLSAATEHGGQGAPTTLGSLVNELISGSNTSFQMYSGLTLGAAELIMSFGTDEQKHLFVSRMLDGTFGGTMCLTEPHAGSDVGDCSTSAVKNADGSYSIKGTKIFISGGDHDLAGNIVHMVLARIQGAPKGTKGLSLFIVPKHWVNADGSVGKFNDVVTASIEHKMGIVGSSTCVLSFGESDACRGFLCGTVEHQGIAQMFQMMNGARILVGVQGVAAASSAYLNALQYAKERKQGSSAAAMKDPNAPRVPIIEHPDIRRMLLDMKARVEGIRLLGLTLTSHIDRAEVAAKSDPDRATYHRGQVDLLTPIFKSYATDQGFQVAATAIQTYGGAGFLKDHPVEQYCRDAKIFSIYEGTNHIQALDLVGRKLRQAGGKPALDFLGDVGRFVEQNASHPRLASGVAELKKVHGAAMGVLGKLMEWGKAGKIDITSLSANRILEIMAELSVGWLLLEGAAIAHEKLGALAEGQPDYAFYLGKCHAALYYALNVMPGALSKAEIVAKEDRSALDIPEAAFATV
ncbi:MAG TPA: acyl-CoA dehydrogenase [Polyangiales bacterium]|nr:acyl-CoA dehydrogenase [Polyangiales bacterium]